MAHSVRHFEGAADGGSEQRLALVRPRMQQAVAAPARGRGEIAHRDKGDAEASQGKVLCDAEAGCPSAHHQDVSLRHVFALKVHRTPSERGMSRVE